MFVIGCDFSTRAVDFVRLDVDSDRATWDRYELDFLPGADAFDRARNVRTVLPGGTYFDDCLAVGIEQPRGRYALVDLARIQGAVLASIPADKLVQPWNPASWRTAVGLAGNASKADVGACARGLFPFGHAAMTWPQDALDAFCIALATRSLIQRDAA